jgi:hypothetical protein
LFGLAHISTFLVVFCLTQRKEKYQNIKLIINSENFQSLWFHFKINSEHFIIKTPKSLLFATSTSKTFSENGKISCIVSIKFPLKINITTIHLKFELVKNFSGFRHHYIQGPIYINR